MNMDTRLTVQYTHSVFWHTAQHHRVGVLESWERGGKRARRNRRAQNQAWHQTERMGSELTLKHNTHQILDSGARYSIVERFNCLQELIRRARISKQPTAEHLQNWLGDGYSSDQMKTWMKMQAFACVRSYTVLRKLSQVLYSKLLQEETLEAV